MINNMNETNAIKTRYTWVDNIKFACCILVVLGHTFMGLAESGIIEKSLAYNLLTQSVYTFHVPLFFVCSGFLYQKSDRVHSVKSWGKNVLDKLLNLGVPYAVFTIITVVFKTVFSDSVNNPSGNLLKTLFLAPVAPYWYLYALFLLFLFIPCLKSKKQATALFFTAFAARIVYLLCVDHSVALPYVLYSMFCRMIWFVIGMCLAFDIFDLKALYSKAVMILFGLTAIGMSIYYYRELYLNQTVQYIIGMLFVISIIILSQNLHFGFIDKVSFKFNEYFMPVYVMHTIFSAGVRILLLKSGVENFAVHLVCGLAAGFLLPAAIYEIAKKIPPLLFFIYPKKAILKMKRKKQ